MLMTSRLLTILVCVCVCDAVVVAADLVIFFPEVQRCTIGAFVGAGVLPAALQVRASVSVLAGRGLAAAARQRRLYSYRLDSQCDK